MAGSCVAPVRWLAIKHRIIQRLTHAFVSSHIAPCPEPYPQHRGTGLSARRWFVGYRHPHHRHKNPCCKKLIGLNLLRSFRRELKSRLSGTEGCTHLTELAGVLPTAAIQAFAGDVLPTRDGATEDDGAHPPFQIDRCHALRRDGTAVEKYYPRWFLTPKT